MNLEGRTQETQKIFDNSFGSPSLYTLLVSIFLKKNSKSFKQSNSIKYVSEDLSDPELFNIKEENFSLFTQS